MRSVWIVFWHVPGAETHVMGVYATKEAAKVAILHKGVTKVATDHYQRSGGGGSYTIMRAVVEE